MAAPPPGLRIDTFVEVIVELARRIERGEAVVLATAVRTFGSPPCDPGHKLLLGRDGPVAGTHNRDA